MKNQQTLNHFFFKNPTLLFAPYKNDKNVCPPFPVWIHHEYECQRVSIRNCQSVSHPLLCTLWPMWGHTVNNKGPRVPRLHPYSIHCPLSSWIFPPWVSATLHPLCRKDASDFGEKTLVRKKRKAKKNHHAQYKSHHLCNQKCELCVNEQLVCCWSAVREPLCNTWLFISSDEHDQICIYQTLTWIWGSAPSTSSHCAHEACFCCAFRCRKIFHLQY